VRKSKDAPPPGVELVVEALVKSKAWSDDALDVCSFRNNLNKLFGIFLDPSNAFVVDAALVDSTLCLDVVRTPEKSFDGAERFEYMGYRLETVCTTGEAGADATSEFCSVRLKEIAGLRVGLAAEQDAELPPEQGGGYVEIKSHVKPSHRGQERTLYRHKMPKWWLQASLGGAECLALGARSKEGVLLELNLVPTADVPRVCAANGSGFSPELVLGRGAALLGHMRSEARKEGAGVTLRWEFVPGERGGAGAEMRCKRVEGSTLAGRVRAAIRSAQGGAGAGAEAGTEEEVGARAEEDAVKRQRTH